MERTASIVDAKQIMGKNFIGVDELCSITDQLPLNITNENPVIPFTVEMLLKKKNDYLLILGVTHFKNNESLNLLNFRIFFGVNPELSEPCFYNQDWYLNEEFMSKPLENKWYLIKKSVFEDSRAQLPNILEKKYSFPTAILCAYTFFVCWFFYQEILWKYDFVWCLDKDHNGDRIYVGKYVDVDGVNKNGFSIHRHLALRNSYSAITVY